jgi:hypothetical protein
MAVRQRHKLMSSLPASDRRAALQQLMRALHEQLGSYSKVASKLGVSERTIRSWIDSRIDGEPRLRPEFAARLFETARELRLSVSDYELLLDAAIVPHTQKRPVFLCHASEDKASVRELYARLNAAGIKAWLDTEDLLPGQQWKPTITRVIRESAAVLACLSRRSTTKRGYVQKEIATALDVADEHPENAVFLIPVRLEPCVVPERLGHLHWVDLFEHDGYGRLLRAVHKAITGAT